MKKMLMLIGLLGIILVGCGKPKIKTYTLAQKEAYLEKANNGDKEAEKFINNKVSETEKIFNETGNLKAQKEMGEWMRMQMSISHGMPEQKLIW